LNSRISSYNSLKTELDPSKQINEIPVLDMPKLNPIFENYCADGEKFFSDGSQSEEKARRYNTAIEEYLLMKHKTDAELQIMEANRVGSDKDISKIVKSTAGMVGLQMPKLYDPNAPKDEAKK
jgi:hypothetical protein